MSGFWDTLTWTPEKDEIQSIYAYVETQRENIPKFPALSGLIADFEEWYGNLGLVDMSPLYSGYTLNAAKQKRDTINAAMGQTLDPTVPPADRANLPPGSAPTSGAFGNVEHGTETALAVGGVLLAGLLAWKLLS